MLGSVHSAHPKGKGKDEVIIFLQNCHHHSHIIKRQKALSTKINSGVTQILPMSNMLNNWTELQGY